MVTENTSELVQYEIQVKTVGVEQVEYLLKQIQELKNIKLDVLQDVEENLKNWDSTLNLTVDTSQALSDIGTLQELIHEINIDKENTVGLEVNTSQALEDLVTLQELMNEVTSQSVSVDIKRDQNNPLSDIEDEYTNLTNTTDNFQEQYENLIKTMDGGDSDNETSNRNPLNRQAQAVGNVNRGFTEALQPIRGFMGLITRLNPSTLIAALGMTTLVATVNALANSYERTLQSVARFNVTFNQYSDVVMSHSEALEYLKGIHDEVNIPVGKLTDNFGNLLSQVRDLTVAEDLLTLSIQAHEQSGLTLEETTQRLLTAYTQGAWIDGQLVEGHEAAIGVFKAFMESGDEVIAYRTKISNAYEGLWDDLRLSLGEAALDMKTELKAAFVGLFDPDLRDQIRSEFLQASSIQDEFDKQVKEIGERTKQRILDEGGDALTAISAQKGAEIQARNILTEGLVEQTTAALGGQPIEEAKTKGEEAVKNEISKLTEEGKIGKEVKEGIESAYKSVQAEGSKPLPEPRLDYGKFILGQTQEGALSQVSTDIGRIFQGDSALSDIEYDKSVPNELQQSLQERSQDLPRIRKLLKDTNFPEEDINDLLANFTSSDDLIGLTNVLERDYKEKFGSLQYAQGGIIPGFSNQEVPVLAHGGEVIFSQEDYQALQQKLDTALTNRDGPVIESITVPIYLDNRLITTQVIDDIERRVRIRGGR